MRGTWIKSTVLMLGLSLAGLAIQAQQSTSATANQSATTQSAASGSLEHGKAGALNLSPEQKKQLHQLRLSARDQAAVIRNDQTLSAEQKQSKLKELRASTREQMKSILTPDQQKMMADRRAARREQIAAKLGLTADQQSKLKDLFRSTHQQRETVLSSTTLSNDQKLAELKQIRESAKTQLASILTPDQLQKFHEMRREHRMHKQG
jgi:Spy/CpxP family protein refolding chaperone